MTRGMSEYTGERPASDHDHLPVTPHATHGPHAIRARGRRATNRWISPETREDFVLAANISIREPPASLPPELVHLPTPEDRTFCRFFIISFESYSPQVTLSALGAHPHPHLLQTRIIRFGDRGAEQRPIYTPAHYLNA